MKRFAALTALLLTCLCANSAGPSVSGIVFHDKNRNGILDAGEKGLKGIPISNGDTIIYTARGGRFTISAEDASCAFPIVPSGYTPTGSNTGNAALKGIQCGEFTAYPIAKQKQRRRFRIAAVGDVQVNDSIELSYAARTIYSELSNRRDIDFSIYLGDLVNDDTTILSTTAMLLEQMPHKSWTVVGNHDLDKRKGQPRTAGHYRRIFGPPDYAFHYGNTLFIILDDVTGYGSRGYTGGLNERQKRFVRNCLGITPPNYNVVMCLHAPVYGSKYQDETATLFSGRERVLIISGHTHMTSRHILAPNVCELVAGASCGSWWTGERGADAVPLALQRCGAPRNYYTVDFTKDGYSFAFKGVGMDDRTGMDVWIKGEELVDMEIPNLAELPDGLVVANIYGGTDITEVEIRIDGGAWQPMEYSPMQPPAISRIVWWNKTAGYPTKYSRRTPFRKSVSPHIWTACLPEGTSSGVHTLEIRASDDYGFETSYARKLIKN